MGAISLDAIPLNWTKDKLTQKIIKIISLCLGPHRDSKICTSSVFEEVHKVAIDLYNCKFGKSAP